MYLGAFPASPAYDSNGRYIDNVGADPDACRAAGGVPGYTDSPNEFTGHTRRSWYCVMPQGNAAGNTTNITVPTAVTTAVSPQVSPVFAQQSNPKDSPISASPSKSETTTANDSGIVQSLLDRIAADQAAREATAQAASAAPSQAIQAAPVDSSAQQADSAPDYRIPAAAFAVGALLLYVFTRKRGK